MANPTTYPVNGHEIDKSDFSFKGTCDDVTFRYRESNNDTGTIEVTIILESYVGMLEGTPRKDFEVLKGQEDDSAAYNGERDDIDAEGFIGGKKEPYNSINSCTETNDPGADAMDELYTTIRKGVFHVQRDTTSPSHET